MVYLKKKKAKESLIVYGPYSRIEKEDVTYNKIDEYGMIINNSPPGYNRGDSLEKNFIGYYLYDDWELVAVSASLWYFDERGKYVGQRHPLLPPNEYPMSRDHYITTLLTLKLYEQRNGFNPPTPKIEEITKETGWIISKMARKTLTLNLWSHALLGSKSAEFFYYILEILVTFFFYTPVHRLGSWIAGFKEEVDQDEWVETDLDNGPKYKQIIDKLIYPSYAMFLTGWQLYILNSFPRLNRLTKKVHRPMIGKTNYVQKMLFGMKGIPRDKIETFVAMKGGRWSGYLNERNDRGMRALNPQPLFNKLDVDLARKLYNETQIK